MKTLLILRHAKSSWKDETLADHERPLKKRGKRDAPRMGKLLKREDLIPDLIISSTAVRAMRTAELVADNCGYEEEMWMTRHFYHADPEDYIEMLRDHVADEHAVVMVVGHNPGMEELVALLTGEPERFTTANIAQVALPITGWSELSVTTRGQLVNLWRPKTLDL